VSAGEARKPGMLRGALLGQRAEGKYLFLLPSARSVRKERQAVIHLACNSHQGADSRLAAGKDRLQQKQRSSLCVIYITTEKLNSTIKHVIKNLIVWMNRDITSVLVSP